MKWLNNIGIGTKVGVAPAIILLMLLVTTLVVRQGADAVEKQVSLIKDLHLPKSELSFDVLRSVRQSEFLIEQFTESGDVFYLSLLDLEHRQMAWVLDESQELDLSEQEKQVFSAIFTAYDEVFQLASGKLSENVENQQKILKNLTELTVPSMLTFLQDLGAVTKTDASNNLSVDIGRAGIHLQNVSAAILRYKNQRQFSALNVLLLEMAASEDVLFYVLEALESEHNPRIMTWVKHLKLKLVELKGAVKEFLTLVEVSEDTIRPFLNKKLIALNDRAVRVKADVEVSVVRSVEHSRQDVVSMSKSSLYLSGFALLVGALLTNLMSRIIVKPVQKLEKLMLTIRETGDFSLRSGIQQTDQVGMMASGLDQMLENLQKVINETNITLKNVSKGDFSQPIIAELKGDLLVLKNGVNGTVEKIEVTMTELNKVLSAMQLGDFSVVIDVEMEGEFLRMLEATQGCMKTVGESIIAIDEVMSEVKQGRFDRQVEIDTQGRFLSLKNSVNSSMHSLNSALTDISAVVQAQAKGDMANKIKAEYPGQLGELKIAINNTSDELNAIVRSILGSSADMVNETAQVSQGNMNLSQRIQEQAAALEETSAAMEQMTATVRQNTETAERANQLSTDVQEEAEKSSGIVKQAENSMQGITDSSKKIADIISVIDGIAFQTNLLALNAAVEAARAGDHGRGFAVVAGEVRQLAQKSAEASKDIKRLIEDSVSKVEEGSAFVEESGNALSDINLSVKNVSQNIAEIAEASRQQQLGIEQINKAITEMDTTTQENAALVEESSAAADQVNGLASDMKNTMGFFKV
jgi:methyl-accepting chemotaxis protein